MNLLQTLSVREKNLWDELLIDLAVAIYYCPKAVHLLLTAEGPVSNPALAGLVVKTIVLAIVAAIVVHGFLLRQDRVEPADERDRQFAARGNQAAYWTLSLLVAVILGNIALVEVLPLLNQYNPLDLARPLVIAHLLLLALMIASLVNTWVKLISYRRGY